jgi:hypothetical protein
MKYSCPAPLLKATALDPGIYGSQAAAAQPKRCRRHERGGCRLHDTKNHEHLSIGGSGARG